MPASGFSSLSERRRPILVAPKHIMHVLFSLGTSGLQKQVVNLINGSDRDRFRHSVCCLEYIGRYGESFDEPAPSIHLMNKKPGLSPLLVPRLARLFRRCDVDVVHTRTFGTLFYSAPAARLARRALVYGEHGDLPMMRHKGRVRWSFRLFARMTDRLYAVTEAGRTCLTELTGRDPASIPVIHNGVESDVFMPGDPAAARRRLGIEADAFTIGFVGRVAPVKNLKALFDALPDVWAAVENTDVIIAGDGPAMKQVRRMAADSNRPDRVHLLGDRDDVHELLPAMSVVVLPSFSEGHSNTILEAASAGCPVIASDVGGNPEIVHDGETGFLFPLDRPKELGRRIIEVARSDALRRRLGANARKLALSEFSIDAMIDRYEKLYEGLGRPKRGEQQ
jgi:glycosyltransferase involved in cell wall biosynthesis